MCVCGVWGGGGSRGETEKEEGERGGEYKQTNRSAKSTYPHVVLTFCGTTVTRSHLTYLPVMEDREAECLSLRVGSKVSLKTK